MDNTTSLKETVQVLKLITKTWGNRYVPDGWMNFWLLSIGMSGRHTIARWYKSIPASQRHLVTNPPSWPANHDQTLTLPAGPLGQHAIRLEVNFPVWVWLHATTSCLQTITVTTLTQGLMTGGIDSVSGSLSITQSWSKSFHGKPNGGDVRMILECYSFLKCELSRAHAKCWLMGRMVTCDLDCWYGRNSLLSCGKTS